MDTSSEQAQRVGDSAERSVEAAGRVSRLPACGVLRAKFPEREVFFDADGDPFVAAKAGNWQLRVFGPTAEYHRVGFGAVAVVTWPEARWRSLVWADVEAQLERWLVLQARDFVAPRLRAA